MDYGGGAVAGSGAGSVLKIVGDLAKGSKMPTVRMKFLRALFGGHRGLICKWL